MSLFPCFCFYVLQLAEVCENYPNLWTEEKCFHREIVLFFDLMWTSVAKNRNICRERTTRIAYSAMVKQIKR